MIHLKEYEHLQHPAAGGKADITIPSGSYIQGLIFLQELPTYSSTGVVAAVYFCPSHFLFISLLHLSFLCARGEREQKHAAL